MTAKHYLSQLRKLDNLIEARKEALKRMRQEETYITGISYDSVRVQTSTVDTGFKRSEEQADKEAELLRLIRKLQDKRNLILDQISLLDNPVHVEVLIDRYVYYHSFEEIADRIHRSYVRTTHIHGDALRRFDEILRNSTSYDKT